MNIEEVKKKTRGVYQYDERSFSDGDKNSRSS